MKLSTIAQEELLKILAKEIGLKRVDKLSPEEIECLGVFLLTLFAESLKLKRTK